MLSPVGAALAGEGGGGVMAERTVVVPPYRLGEEMGEVEHHELLCESRFLGRDRKGIRHDDLSRSAHRTSKVSGGSAVTPYIIDTLARLHVLDAVLSE